MFSRLVAIRPSIIQTTRTLFHYLYNEGFPKIQEVHMDLTNNFSSLGNEIWNCFFHFTEKKVRNISKIVAHTLIKVFEYAFLQ